MLSKSKISLATHHYIPSSVATKRFVLPDFDPTLNQMEELAERVAYVIVPPDADIAAPTVLFVALCLVIVPFHATSVAYRHKRNMEMVLGCLMTAFFTMIAIPMCVTIFMDPHMRQHSLRNFAAAGVLFASFLGVICALALGLPMIVVWFFKEPERTAKLFACVVATWAVYGVWTTGAFR